MKNNRSTRSRGRTVLGRTISHENSACLLRDGKILAAIATERLTRKKYDQDNNDLAIQYCLDVANISIDDVDLIVQNDPKLYFRENNRSNLILKGDRRVWTISHHLAHAWAAYALSPFKSAIVVVIDGRGNFVPPEGDVILGPDIPAPWEVDGDGEDWAIEVESIYLGEKDRLRLLSRRRNRGLPLSIGAMFSSRGGLYPDEYSGYYQYAGLGALYEQACYGIFDNNLDAGKVMGLASFSKPNPEQVEKIIQIHKGEYKLGTDWLFEINPPFNIDKGFSQAAQIAANVQAALEIGVESVMAKAKRLGQMPRLCYSGGVALNGLANERIIQSGLFEDVFIQPACNDAGTSLGCAFFGHAYLLSLPVPRARFQDFTGKKYTTEVAEALERWKSTIIATPQEDPVKEAVHQLMNHRVIGWFHGGSELGPRALGHRSILCLPAPGSMKNKLNNSVKRRESFRPFAPVVPLEVAPKYFELDGESPFMLRIVNVRPEHRASLPAITHVDGTARVQTVRREDNPLLHRLLIAIGDKWGVPVLLNTSFNTAGFPMVETPDDAIQSFLISGIDSLFLENFHITRRYNSADSILNSSQPARWELPPNVKIIRVFQSDRESYILRKGLRKRVLSSEEASSLIAIVSLATAAEQLSASTIERKIFLSFLDILLKEGWIYGSLA